MEMFDHPHVHIKDRERVEKILTGMIQDGPSKLQVIADFDRTLSKFSENGKMCATCFDVLEEGMGKNYKEKARKLYEKYSVIEYDPHMTIEEKTPYMVEWWTYAHELMMEYRPTKQQIHGMVEASSIKLRDGYTEFFDTLHLYNIPLLIFSAGISQIIQEAIKVLSTMTKNMHVVSNEIAFDESGKMTGFKEGMIHMFNKNENAVHDSDYFDNLRQHTSLLLMGDSLGDLQMSTGADKIQYQLTIGFLNTRVEEHLEKYMSSFDIVIVEDESLNIANSIVKKIIDSASN